MIRLRAHGKHRSGLPVQPKGVTLGSMKISLPAFGSTLTYVPDVGWFTIGTTPRYDPALITKGSQAHPNTRIEP